MSGTAPDAVGPAGAVPEVAGTPVRPELRLEVVAHHVGQFGAPDAGDTTGYGLQRQVVTLAPAAVRPYGSWFDAVLAAAGVDPAAAIEKVVVEHDELTLFVTREHLLDVARPLRDDQDLRFELCLGVSGVHYPEDLGRVIGRSGRTARALRTVVGALADAPVRVDVVDTDRR